MSVMGTRVQRREDPDFLTGANRYTADLQDPLLEGALHVHFVRSTMAHATLTEVDVTEAQAAPGVVAVYTGVDTSAAEDLPPFPVAIPGMIPEGLARPYIASETVRFVGDVVAVIVAESKEAAEDASELVIVDYDPLDVVIDPAEAEKGELLLFPDHGSNVALEVPFGHTGDELFDGCEVVVDRTITNQRLAVCPLEPRALAATWHEGRLVVFASTQAPHGVKGKLAGLYGLEPEQVRVIAPAVGGGFGAKIDLQADEALLPWIARRLDRPVRWAETRGENMVAMPHGRGQVLRIEIGGTRDGTVEAYRLTVLQDAGAYPGMGAFLPFMTRTMAPGVYDIPKVECERAVGDDQHHADRRLPRRRTARGHRCDRAGHRPVRRSRSGWTRSRSAARTSSPPTRSRSPRPPARSTTSATTPRPLDRRARRGRLRRAAGRAGGPPRRRRPGAARHRRLASTSRSPPAPPASSEYGEVEIARATARSPSYTGTSAHGQGHSTAFAMLAHELRASRWTRSRSSHGDTDRVAEGDGTFGSRSLQLGGSARLDGDARRSWRRPARSRPSCSRRTPTTSCSTSTAAPSTSTGSPAVGQDVGRGRRRRRHLGAPR